MMLPLIYLKILIKKQSDSGMSLMESLVAIVIISLMAVVTTPPLILAMATRIQTRRAQTAVTLAQKELERIRLIVDSGDYLNNMLPPVASGGGAAITTPSQISTAGAPNAILPAPPCAIPEETCTPYSYNQAWWVDDSQEYFIQTFRTTGVQQDNQVVVFRMGIRVYSKVAEADLGSLRTESAPLYLTRGAGERTVVNRDGSNISARQRQFPLAVIYADFSRGDLIGSLERYHEFIGD
ncbi:MAG: type II secretion system protein [Gloeocapsa sp. DLM2.Bin57]|nr:MAG: type II secretion system protein [Gloeocapsa sp. DLM2.Bin57]